MHPWHRLLRVACKLGMGNTVLYGVLTRQRTLGPIPGKVHSASEASW